MDTVNIYEGSSPLRGVGSLSEELCLLTSSLDQEIEQELVWRRGRFGSKRERVLGCPDHEVRKDIYVKS